MYEPPATLSQGVQGTASATWAMHGGRGRTFSPGGAVKLISIFISPRGWAGRRAA